MRHRPDPDLDDKWWWLGLSDEVARGIPELED
jgi:hypothetical protein